jgi:hypothetical protein
MRTTIDFSDELLRRAKKQAADEKKPLREVIEASLRAYLGGRHRRPGYRLHWRTERGKIAPGVRLDDREALWELMDGRA